MVAPLGLATNSEDLPQVSEWNWYHQNDNFQPPPMWDFVEIDAPGFPGMRGCFVDHGYGYKHVDRVKPWNLDQQINQFKAKDNLQKVTKFPINQNHVTVPHKNYPKTEPIHQTDIPRTQEQE